MLRSRGQIVGALWAELRKKLLDIDNYFFSLPFTIPIFSTVSWPSMVPRVLQAKSLWFYSPQTINSLSPAVMQKREQTSCMQWVGGSGSYFYLKVLFSHHTLCTIFTFISRSTWFPETLVSYSMMQIKWFCSFPSLSNFQNFVIVASSPNSSSPCVFMVSNNGHKLPLPYHVTLCHLTLPLFPSAYATPTVKHFG